MTRLRPLSIYIPSISTLNPKLLRDLSPALRSCRKVAYHSLELFQVTIIAQRLSRFPDGIVDENVAVGNTAVQLSGKIARAQSCVDGGLAPNFDCGIHLTFGDGESVGQDDRADFGC
jgi:hypothetical protein